MNNEKVWYDGNIVNAEDATVPVLSFGLQYGWGVFEGIRAYPSGSEYLIFRLRDHVSRLFRSAKLLGLEIPYSQEEVYSGVCRTVLENKGSDYIRPIAFGGQGSSVALGTSDMVTHVAVAAVKMGEYVPGASDKGIDVVTSAWEKPRWRAMPVTAKICGGYIGSIMAKRDAGRRGADEALMLNFDGTVAEGSAENIFIIEDDVISTPPLSAGILEGITRDTVMQLSLDMGYKVCERNLAWDEVASADEVFMCGTALEIQGVRSLDGRIIGDGGVGSVTRQIMTTYHDLVRGRIPKYLAWCDRAESVLNSVLI